LKVSVIIPNRNDTISLGVTVRTIVENLRDIDGEIIIVDNSDEQYYNLLKTPNISPIPLGYINDGILKIVRQDRPGMYAAAQKGAEVAAGEYLMKCDSHVIWGANVIKDCLSFMNNHHEAGVCSSPIGWMNLTDRLAKSNIAPNANGGIFGGWGEKSELPKKVSWNFGYRIVKKSLFHELNGYSFFADKHVSWGGGEFYLAIKSWLLGYPNWAIKANPVYHIGPHSKELEALTGIKFRVYGSSGNGRQGIGILAAFYALGGDNAREECMKSGDGLKKQYGIDIDRDWDEAKAIAHDDHEWIKTHQKISFQELLERKPWDEH
jgi:glycosyltransferase involved in cell wall biosynthesis